MKQILKREDVAQAVAALTSQNKKPTLAAIHAALGGKGSLSTLVRLKGELEVAKPAIDAPEAEQAFRTVWGMAVDQGRKEQEAKLAELRDDLKAVATENERLDGIAASARNRVADLEALLARAEADRQTAQLASSEAGTQAARALQQLADAQSSHATHTAALQGSLATLQAKLDEAVAKAHNLELDLVRAQARLEAKSARDMAKP